MAMAQMQGLVGGNDNIGAKPTSAKDHNVAT